MEVLKVFGSVFEERAVIAGRYLGSRRRGEASGLKMADVAFEED